MKIAVGTITDKNYLLRALTLYRSLQPYSQNVEFRFFILDKITDKILERLGVPSNERILLDEVQPVELRDAVVNRNQLEYCATAKGFVLRHLLQTVEGIDWSIWLDSDMLAYSDPTSALLELAEYSILITPHTDNEIFISDAIPVVGSYNAGFVGFKNDEEGLRALNWWISQCVHECPQVPTPSAYTDQKYLNELPVRFEGVFHDNQMRLNVGPWNINRKQITAIDGKVYIDQQMLALYHFQGMKFIGRYLVDLYSGEFPIDSTAARFIYSPYIRLIERTASEIAKVGGKDILPSVNNGSAEFRFKYLRRLFSGDQGIQIWLKKRSAFNSFFR